MMALITLIALISAYLIASRLTKTDAELTADREQRTQAALQEAKAALIAYAANPNLTQIGSLPCPDRKLPTDTNAGDEESLCGSDAVRIGRLPWKTLNVSSNLRDGSGEPLWYVLSANFRKLINTTIINSDTQGQITVTGSAPASTVVALIIAPGMPLQNQNRDKTDLAALNDPSNYLEGVNAGANDNSFETRVPPNDRDANGGLIFNDRALAITHAELFAVVEPVVINKIRDATVTNVRAAIEVYRTTWGRYPFPAAFGSPGTSDFKGTVGTSEGLLPMTTDSAFVSWKTSSPSPTVAMSGGTGTVTNTDCGASTATQLDCQFDYVSGAPLMTITATANNPGLAFVSAFAISDLTVERTASGSPAICAPLCNWSGYSTTSINSTTSVSASSTYTLSSDASGAVSLILQMPSRGLTARTIRLRIPVLPYHSITTTTDPYTGWFVSNAWHKVAYYAVSANYLPGGTPPPADGTPPCWTATPLLTVNGLPTNEYPCATDKNAILILTGRSLNGTSRPSGTLTNYLEGQNASTVDGIFAHRVGAPGAANDRVVVLSP